MAARPGRRAVPRQGLTVCRGFKFCSELGDNPAGWSKLAPLPPPEFFESELDQFCVAAKHILAGNLEDGISALGSIRNNELNWWLHEHGQMSGIHRNRILAIEEPPYSGPIDKRPLNKVEETVFSRDNYRCRYCGVRVLSKQALKAVESAAGKGTFLCSSNSKNDHGIVVVFKAVADHVVPTRCGGRIDPDNLVTSCQACNYGKWHFTLRQLGIADPRERQPMRSSWDGLRSRAAQIVSRN